VTLQGMDGVDVVLTDGILTVLINRVERRNAVTPDQMHFIGQTCAAAEKDDGVRVVVLRGTGNAFCAGADLADVDLSADGGQVPPVSMGANLFVPIVELSKPLIGAVNGMAAGGGLGLALCCDIRLAAANAFFTTAFTRIGLTANDAVGWLLPRTVGTAKALELIYLSDRIDACEAQRIGLVNHVYAEAEFDEAVAAFAARVAAAAPIAVRLSKRLVLDGAHRTYREHVLAQEYASLANRVLADDDIQEGVHSFKEKRAPRFRGSTIRRKWENY
jgi:2-(1,2-epoxy-1,2-dihydrophenyl)acetyl-CoA isomerase